MELGVLPSFGEWDEDDGGFGGEDDEDDMDMDIGDLEDEENFSNLLQSQMNATWRSNLLPRSRFLELTVFKKMLAQGLHLTRHDKGKAKPTTVFADKEFRHIWWYKSLGMDTDEFAISSLLTVGTAIDPKSGSTRQDVIDLSTVDESDHGVVFSLQFSGSSKRRGAVGRTNSKTKSSGGEASLMTSHGVVGAQTTSEAPEKSEVFFTCESLELYHLVLDGFGMILEHAEAAVSEPNNTEVHHLTIPHTQLPRYKRLLLSFHHLYKPEHHPNHPRHILRIGQEVEVLYSSEYVIEFNGQLMRLPNPFFGPGMNCRGKVVSYDPETENYAVSYVDGPFEHDEPLPSAAAVMDANVTKKNFPKGTLFDYVKRANLIADLGAENGNTFYIPKWPVAVVAVSLLQFCGSLYSMWDEELGGLAEGGETGFSGRALRPTWMFAMQVGEFGEQCPDNRYQAWRLWTYQFLPSSWLHLCTNLFVQLLLGIPINIVHGDLVYLALTQGLGVPLAALAVGYSDSFKVIQGTVVAVTGSVFALVGTHLATLLLNYSDSSNGLIPREGRLLLLAFVMSLEAAVRALFPDPNETSTAQHVGSAIAGCLFAVAYLRNLKMTHAVRTYVIPAAIWLLAALVIASIGWCMATNPPTNFFLFPSTEEPPCCWRAYDCDLVLDDLKYFVCHNKLLVENNSATAEVKAQTCEAYLQYAGLQIKEANRSDATRGFFAQ